MRVKEMGERTIVEGMRNNQLVLRRWSMATEGKLSWQSKGKLKPQDAAKTNEEIFPAELSKDSASGKAVGSLVLDTH